MFFKRHRGTDSLSPALGARAVAPSNSTEITTTRSLYVGTGGNVAVTMVDGDQVTFSNVPSGTMLPIQVIQVRATGTTAADILAMY
jgi:hypothetical protein